MPKKKHFCPQLYNFVPHVNHHPLAQNTLTHIYLYQHHTCRLSYPHPKSHNKNKPPAQLVTNASGSWEN